MSTEAAKAAALSVLRQQGEYMPASKVAAEIGCSRRRLTGDTGGALFLLEEEGLVTRTGRKRSTLWRAT